MNLTDKIFIAGHNGMVGSAIYRKLKDEGYSNLLTATSKDIDLRNQQAVLDFFNLHKPQYVFIAAGKVGGIHANNNLRAEFLYDNLMIELNIIHSAYLYKVKKLLFLGSSSIYPKFAPQPLKESSLLEGSLEPTNEGYAIAKIAGIKMCDTYRQQYGCNFISIIPTNLYGYNDNYDLQNGHVLPVLIRKFHEAKINKSPQVIVWGTGKPLREFMFAGDLVDACLYLMYNYDNLGWVNAGTGEEISIQDLALHVKDVVGYKGDLVFDTSKPDGIPRKLLDVSLLHSLGFKHKTGLKEGLKKVYTDFIENIYPNMQ